MEIKIAGFLLFDSRLPIRRKKLWDYVDPNHSMPEEHSEDSNNIVIRNNTSKRASTMTSTAMHKRSSTGGSGGGAAAMFAESKISFFDLIKMFYSTYAAEEQEEEKLRLVVDFMDENRKDDYLDTLAAKYDADPRSLLLSSSEISKNESRSCRNADFDADSDDDSDDDDVNNGEGGVKMVTMKNPIIFSSHLTVKESSPQVEKSTSSSTITAFSSFRLPQTQTTSTSSFRLPASSTPPSPFAPQRSGAVVVTGAAAELTSATNTSSITTAAAAAGGAAYRRVSVMPVDDIPPEAT